VPDFTRLDGPCYIVSDHHFGIAPPESLTAFLTFLGSLKGRAAALVINGDLFDFWFEWKSVIPRSSFRVLAALAQLVDDRVPVIWIGGNHDCWGGDVLRDDVGVHYMLGVWEGEIAGWQTRIEHGDGLRPREDRRYRALRAVIRNPLAIAGMRLLHPDVGSWLATSSSTASRVHRARDGGAALRDVAYARLEADNAPEVYVLGHTHVPALEKTQRGGVYANAGSWSDGGSHLVVRQDRIELCSYSESAGEHCLNSIDRGAKE
jgi:UDP-2,3-diacylglucosamine hydrolase